MARSVLPSNWIGNGSLHPRAVCCGKNDEDDDIYDADDDDGNVGGSYVIILKWAWAWFLNVLGMSHQVVSKKNPLLVYISFVFLQRIFFISGGGLDKTILLMTMMMMSDNDYSREGSATDFFWLHLRSLLLHLLCPSHHQHQHQHHPHCPVQPTHFSTLCLDQLELDVSKLIT